MKITEGISLLRNGIKKYQDDSSYTDEYLWNVLKIYVNKYQSERIKEDYRTSDRLKSVYCAPLEIDSSHDCDCVDVGCKVHKTVYKIPQTYSGKYRDEIRVFTLDYKEIFPVSSQEQKTNQLVDIKKGVVTYTFLNRRIVLWNTNTTQLIPAILIEGIWEDETEWNGITYCDFVENPDADIALNCFNLDEVEIGLEGDFMAYAIEEATRLLMSGMSLREDVTNNRNNEL